MKIVERAVDNPMRRCVWRIRRAAIFAAAALAALIVPRVARAAGCGTIVQIGAAGTCGILIKNPGCYQLTGDQTASSPGQDCITVAASNVFLTLTDKARKSHMLTGTGANDTAAGIHVLAKTASGSPISNVAIGAGSVSKFNIGVLVEASSVFVATQINDSNVAGVQLNNAKNCSVGASTSSATAYGVVLSGSNNNLVQASALGFGGNNRAGVILGHSNGNIIAAGPSFLYLNGDGIVLDSSSNNTIAANTTVGNCVSCGSDQNGIVLQHSSNNNLLAGNLTYNSANYGIWLNGSSNNEVVSNATSGIFSTGGGVAGIFLCSSVGPNPGENCSTSSAGNHLDINFLAGSNQYGILLDKDSSANSIVDTVVQGPAGIDDLFDGNSNCDSNTWFGNGFIKASPSSCIH